MENENKIACDKILSGLDKIIEKKIYEILDQRGVEYSDYGTVSAITESETDDAGNITAVKRADVLVDGSTVAGLLNKTGDILEVGDNVKVYGSRSNLANRYIGLKI